VAARRVERREAARALQDRLVQSFERVRDWVRERYAEQKAADLARQPELERAAKEKAGNKSGAPGLVVAAASGMMIKMSRSLAR
jgi:hypothetical protein